MGSIPSRSSLFRPVGAFSAFALVFIAYFLGAALGIYVFNTFQTSPALLWPPVGIAFAAVIFGGYRMWIPVFLGQFFVLLTVSPLGAANAFLIASGYAIEVVVALYVARRFAFQPELEKVRNVVILVGMAFALTVIAPVVATLSQEYLLSVPTAFVFNVGRIWGAGIFSVLVIVPLVTTWYSQKKTETTKEKIEIAAALILLMANNYFLFWTSYPQYFGIAVIFFLPAVLIWFALRLNVRWMTLGIFLTAIFGIAGSILGNPGHIALNVQLLSDEVYIGFVAAIFLVFVAVVEERRAAYGRLAAAFESTLAADKAKSEFIAILGHELRNPLAPIVSSLELLTLQPQTAESIDTIHNAQEHAEMMRRLLDDLLDTARLTQQKLKLQKKNVSLRKLIDQSVTSVQEDIHGRRHQLQISMPADDIMIYADPVRVKQIIINLLTNASKYTERNGKIELTTERMNNEVVIRVTDNGIGIAREKLSYLFEPFKQLEMPGHRRAGLGIGLFLTKRLTEMHGGRVTAESQGLGRGSVFSVYLPLVSDEVIEQVTPSVRGDDVPGKQRMLIVDDNEAAANSLKKLLRHHGQEVEVAYSGKHAIDMVEMFHPNFILLDIGMPDMDGYAVARKLRAKGSEATIIALSGYGQESDRQQSKQAGFDYHLVKPVSAYDVIALVNTSESARVSV